jgi:hypothetical protein
LQFEKLYFLYCSFLGGFAVQRWFAELEKGAPVTF